MKINQKTKNIIAKKVEEYLKNDSSSLRNVSYYGIKGVYNLSDEELIELAEKYNVNVEYD
jgi:hypothetical protein